jgi:tripartite ATP-independent transporter DctP family solute receptor
MVQITRGDTMRIARLAIVTATTFFALTASVSAQEVRTLRLGFGTKLDGAAGMGMQKMAQVLQEKSGGSLKLALFPNSQLGGEPDMLNQTRAGSLDIVVSGTGVVSSIEPSVQVTILPFIWKSHDSFWKTVNGPLGRKLLDNFESKGLKGLAWGTFGERCYIANGFEINGVAALKGRKMRVTQSQMFLKTMEALGATPQPIAWPEVYTALQQKTVDGVETSIWSIPEANLQEVTTSITVTNPFIDTATFLMNKRVYDSLKPEQQKALMEAAQAGGDVMFQAVTKATADSLKLLESKGLKVLKPDPKPFADAVKPVYDLFTPSIGAQLIAEVQAAQK